MRITLDNHDLHEAVKEYLARRGIRVVDDDTLKFDCQHNTPVTYKASIDVETEDPNSVPPPGGVYR